MRNHLLECTIEETETCPACVAALAETTPEEHAALERKIRAFLAPLKGEPYTPSDPRLAR